jgi:hypothetical protein
MITRFKQRIARLETSSEKEMRTKKRALPEWLQSIFELDGYVFDVVGQIVRASDALNSETTTAFS